MTKEEIKEAVLRALRSIAPEADVESLKPNEDLRDQLDIDSMDILNFAIGLKRELGVDVPEVDLPKLLTLDECIGYLEARVG